MSQCLDHGRNPYLCCASLPAYYRVKYGANLTHGLDCLLPKEVGGKAQDSLREQNMVQQDDTRKK